MLAKIIRLLKQKSTQPKDTISTEILTQQFGTLIIKSKPGSQWSTEELKKNPCFKAKFSDITGYKK